jgi:alpha-tubulin suppressor-like RCC1 family protein
MVVHNTKLAMHNYSLLIILTILFVLNGCSSSSGTNQTAYVSCENICAGGVFELFIKDDGSLWAWGNNHDGQLGIGTNKDSEFPIEVGSDKNWVDIAAGTSHTVALKTDGTLWAWGTNSSYQLGIGSNVNISYRNEPVQVGTDNDWEKISAGDSHTIALKNDGTLWAWGVNGDYGQLGIPGISFSEDPRKVGNDTDWIDIDTGSGDHDLALKTDGSLWSWGRNDCGELGIIGVNIKIEPQKIDAGYGWVKISAGSGISMAIRNDGSLWAWGCNDSGQLGIGSFLDSSIPVQVGFDQDWVVVSAGDKHTLALKQDGTLWAWGLNDSGQLGIGTYVNSNSPVQIGSDHDWAAVSAGFSYSIAKKTNKSLWVWGSNFANRIGNNIGGNSNIPVHVKY